MVSAFVGKIYHFSTKSYELDKTNPRKWVIGKSFHKLKLTNYP